MKNILIGLLLLCTQALSQRADAQTQLFCKQYTITDHKFYVTFTSPICYKSVVRLEIRSNQEFTLTTDSLSLRFIIIYKQRRVDDSDVWLVSLAGYPEQVYAFSRRVDKVGHFYLSCVPTEFGTKHGKIQGTAIEISNIEICDTD